MEVFLGTNHNTNHITMLIETRLTVAAARRTTAAIVPHPPALRRRNNISQQPMQKRYMVKTRQTYYDYHITCLPPISSHAGDCCISRVNLHAHKTTLTKEPPDALLDDDGCRRPMVASVPPSLRRGIQQPTPARPSGGRFRHRGRGGCVFGG